MEAAGGAELLAVLRGAPRLRGLHRGHLGGRRRAGTDADAEPSGLDLLAGSLGSREGDVSGMGVLIPCRLESDRA